MARPQINAHNFSDSLSEISHAPIATYKSAWNDILFEEETVYLITWNPKPQFYGYDKSGENNFDVQWWTMVNHMNKHIRCLDKYALVPEVSEQGKLHLHGWYTVKDHRKYKRGFLPSLRATGFIKVSKVKKHQWKTYRYHIKDLKDGSTRKLMYPVVLTHITRERIMKYYNKQLCFVPVHDKYEKRLKSIYTYLGALEASEDSSFSL